MGTINIPRDFNFMNVPFPGMTSNGIVLLSLKSSFYEIVTIGNVTFAYDCYEDGFDIHFNRHPIDYPVTVAWVVVKL